MSTRRARAALAALSIGTFSFVTVEILPVGLLTVIADDLDRSRSSVGLLVTGYALVVVVAALPLTRLTLRLRRRTVLGGSLAVFVAATTLSAFAWSYEVLLVARLTIALAQALFWSIVIQTATGLFPPQDRGRMIARLAIGTSLAPVLGVPAGTWFGHQAGWRAAFLVAAGVGLATCLAVIALLPSVPATVSTAIAGSAPDRRRYAILVVVTAIAVAGAMTVFTYITPFLLDVSGFPPSALGPLLLVSGVAGVAGTLSVGRFLDGHPWAAVVVPLALLSAAATGLNAGGDVQAITIVMLAVFGLAFNALVAAVQNRTLQVAPGSIDIAAAGSGTAFNVGIAAGSFLGGLLLATFGPHGVTLAGGALLILACGLMLAEPRLSRRRPSGVAITEASPRSFTAAGPGR
jgi:DHA1 family L-arabinose/isopropyl-beta-D-thiogalactopyranoside export protein-like MFS transporter/DHA1 family inner membrane transport protein